MPAASPTLSVQPELMVGSGAPLDIAYPELTETGAICIGLTIDWRHQEILRTYALRHTVPDEHARAARFLRAEDSLRHLLGRTILRRVAAHYGGMDPMQHIRSNTWGKPELAGSSVGCNISHAGSQVWVAVSRFSHVGIDVESASVPSDFHDIAAGFHPDETAALRKMPDPKLATMRCWSRKEAVSKATGMGLSLPLCAYAVECDTRHNGWLRVAPPKTLCSQWTTVDIPVAKDYVGALAVMGRCDKITVLKIRISARNPL